MFANMSINVKRSPKLELARSIIVTKSSSSPDDGESRMVLAMMRGRNGSFKDPSKGLRDALKVDQSCASGLSLSFYCRITGQQ